MEQQLRRIQPRVHRWDPATFLRGWQNRGGLIFPESMPPGFERSTSRGQPANQAANQPSNPPANGIRENLWGIIVNILEIIENNIEIYSKTLATNDENIYGEN